MQITWRTDEKEDRLRKKTSPRESVHSDSNAANPLYQTPRSRDAETDDPIQLLERMIEGNASPSPGKHIKVRKLISHKKMMIEQLTCDMEEKMTKAVPKAKAAIEGLRSL